MRAVIAFFLVLFAANSFASLKDMLFQRQLEQQQLALAGNNDAIIEGAYAQRIDSDNPHSATFKQRFYIDETFAPNNHLAPVFFYICGEATCSKGVLRGAIYAMAKQFGAKLVALEHRYYGKSLPVSSFSTNDLRFLSTEAALSDLANFQQFIVRTKGWQGKWVAFGGSYPGSLSAFYRLKHPELVVASIASSAPVKAKANFFEYDAHVAKVLQATGCLRQTQSVIQRVEQQIATAEGFKAAKRGFAASEITQKDDFLWLLAEVVASYVQYGQQQAFCNGLLSAETPLAGYQQAALSMYQQYGVRAVDFTPQAAMSERIEDYSQRLGMRQWFYQSCKEYGYWQAANINRQKRARSVRLNDAYFTKVCQRLFAISHAANTIGMNQRYYQHFLSEKTSDILFTNGAIDPWSRLSLSQKNGNASNARNAYFTIDGHAHCADLHSPKAADDEPLKEARRRIAQLLKRVLA